FCQGLLARGGVEQVDAAHHVCNFLEPVVDDHDELISPEPIGTAEDEVAHFRCDILAMRALPPINEAAPSQWNLQAPGPRLHTFAQPVAAGAGVGTAGEHAPRTGASIDMASRLQLLERRLIKRKPFRLPD